MNQYSDASPRIAVLFWTDAPTSSISPQRDLVQTAQRRRGRSAVQPRRTLFTCCSLIRSPPALCKGAQTSTATPVRMLEGASPCYPFPVVHLDRPTPVNTLLKGFEMAASRGDSKRARPPTVPARCSSGDGATTMPRPPWRAVPWTYRIRQWATKGGGVQRRSKPLPAGGI